MVFNQRYFYLLTLLRQGDEEYADGYGQLLSQEIFYFTTQFSFYQIKYLDQ
ncbi:MAG: hypothetical protein ACTS8R_07175 [Arsenophonus sp. NC-QC1-MAG3]